MVVFELGLDLAQWKHAAAGGEMGFPIFVSIFIVQRVECCIFLHGKVGRR